MIRRFPVQLRVAIGFIVCVAPVLIARAAPKSRDAKGSGPITKETAVLRLKRVPIIQAAIGQGEAFAGTKNCAVNFQELRELKQFEPGSAFEYKVRITCESKEKGDFEHGATIEVEGQNLNYGEPLQEIRRLSFFMAG